ncbi:MAG: helix-turn-helix domain-containing protein [Patescibacteria group bacterium]
MKKILDYLGELEFSNVEAQIYLALLEKGSLTVAELAQEVKINRTAAYPSINRLRERGVLAEDIKGPQKKFIASEPERLYYFIEKKRDTIKSLERRFPDIIQTITTAPQTQQTDDVKVVSYKGEVGVKKIYKEALGFDELRSYVKLEKSTSVLGDNVQLFNTAFARNPRLRVKEIYYKLPLEKMSVIQKVAQNKHYHYKFMLKKLNLTSGDTLIYDGKVAIIDYSNKINTVVLYNKNYYQNAKELFDFIWDMLPEPKKMNYKS